MQTFPPITLMLQELRHNWRLRLGAWLIVAILAGYLILFIAARQQALKGEYLEQSAQAARLTALAGHTGWLERAKAAKASLVQLESQLSQVESRGLAQAQVQTWLENHLKKLHIRAARSQVEQAAKVHGNRNVLQVRATVQAPYEPAGFAKLLRAVEVGPPLMAVEQLDITLQRNPRFTLIFKTYFQGAGE